MAVQPLIIEAAINGATPKTRNPNVPRSPAEIAGDALACLEAGASIVHNHNDEMLLTPDGVHAAAPYIEAWRAILAERPDALLYPTMGGGGPHTTIERRYAHIPALAEAGVMRLGLIDPGSVNRGPLDRDGLPMATDLTYINTLKDTRHMVEMCEKHRLGPSVSCFEPGFVRTAVRYAQAGRLPAGALIKFYFGGPAQNFGLAPTAKALDAYVEMLDGTELPWSVAVLGGDCLASGMARLAIERGGHVRVGLEDYAGPGTPANVELVRALVKLAGECGRPVATPDETAAVLGLPRGR
ncbi:MAG: 3-keto-5-aminohexanoate cleavage protein [Dehalococcoidia bacterium]